MSENDGDYLLVSSKILAGFPFDKDKSENYVCSDIRNWLNQEFYNKAFSKKQKKYIQTTAVENKSNICDYGKTNDKIFLLSYEDVFKNDRMIKNERQRPVTGYASIVTSYYDCMFSRWWLRSYESYDLEGGVRALAVDEHGQLVWEYIGDDSIGVVPAMRIHI